MARVDSSLRHPVQLGSCARRRTDSNMWQRQAKRGPNIVGVAVLNGGECERRITAVDGHAQTEIGGHRRLGVDAQFVQTVQHIGAGLIQGSGEDAQIGGQGRTDFHHRIIPLGAPERGSSLPVPNRRVALHGGEHATQGQDPSR